MLTSARTYLALGMEIGAINQVRTKLSDCNYVAELSRSEAGRKELEQARAWLVTADAHEKEHGLGSLHNPDHWFIKDEERARHARRVRAEWLAREDVAGA